MLIFLFPLLAVQYVVPAATNRTIDDTLGDSVSGVRPNYFPSAGVWEDATCKGCAIQPDPSLAFDGTWTAATYNPTINTSIELSFKGTAIYVFFILANNVAPGITTVTECNFTLDGILHGKFVHQPNETNFDLQYNQMVFSSENLLNINHTLVISTSGVDHDVFINFDYANYTVPDETPVITFTSSIAGATTAMAPQSSATSPSSRVTRSSSGVIAGIVVGIVVLLIITVAGFIYWRRQRRRRMSGSDNITPPIRQTAFQINPFPAYQTFAARSNMYPQSIITGASQPGESSREYTQSDFYISESSRSRNHQRQDTEMRQSDAYSGPSTEGEQQFRIISDTFSSPVMIDDQPLPLTPPSSRTHDAAALRQARQMELETQMRRIKQELRELNNEAAGRRASLASSRGGTDEDDQGLRELREQIQVMKSQMEILRQQANSPWAQGLSDVPPPGYYTQSLTMTLTTG